MQCYTKHKETILTVNVKNYMNKAIKIEAYKINTKYFTNHLRIFMKHSGIFTEYATLYLTVFRHHCL